jgi:RNA-directed DNA polymerase
MLRDNMVLTVYVDDITLSGAGLVRWHFCPIKKTFASAGMTVHKTRFFYGRPAPVTGAILSGDKVYLPNRRHLRIAEGIRLLTAEPLRSERRRLSAKLIGQVHEAASVDENCRARSRGYLRIISHLVSAPERSGPSGVGD